MTTHEEFNAQVEVFVVREEAEYAIASLNAYLNTTDFTGRAFEQLLDSDHPDTITSRDIVAVSMLGVNVPAEVTLWLLGDGRDEVASLLAEIQSNWKIWTKRADLSPDSNAQQLRRLLSRRGMGRTIKSKLMAGKRPHLIPIYDSKVGKALGIGPHDDDWNLWRNAFTSLMPDGHLLRDRLAEIRTAAGASQRISLLRTIDIIVWMRIWGWQWARTTPLPYHGGTPLPQNSIERLSELRQRIRRS
jgi:hypothetical protein